MRALLFALLLALSLSPFALSQAATTITPDCQIAFNFGGLTGNTAAFDNRTGGCIDWLIEYTSSGHTVLSIVFQTAPDSSGTPGSWSTFTALTGSNPNTATTQASSTFNGYFPWLRVTLSSSTTAGTIKGIAYGWKYHPVAASVTISGGTTSVTQGTVPWVVAGTAATGASPSGAPVYNAGLDFNGLVRPFLLDPNGGQIPATANTNLSDGVSNVAVTPVGNSNTPTRQIVYPFLFNGSTWDREYACTGQAAISLSGSGNTEIVPLSGSTVIRICHVSFAMQSSVDVKFTQGTGSNCASGTADISGVYQDVIALALDFPDGNAMTGTAGNAICINLGAAVTGGGFVKYARY